MGRKNNKDLLIKLEQQYLAIEGYYINLLQSTGKISYMKVIKYFEIINKLPITERIVLIKEIHETLENVRKQKIENLGLKKEQYERNEKDIVKGLLEQYL